MTKIEWTDVSWNPVTGCTKISPGCANCYAERNSKRFRGRFGYPTDDPFRVTLHPRRIWEPLRWRKPRGRVFVCSMSDLFHEDVPDEFIDRVFGVMVVVNARSAARAGPPYDQRHNGNIFQVLTKRPRRMLEYLRGMRNRCITLRPPGWGRTITPRLRSWPYPYVQVGVSVENQDAMWRVEALVSAVAAVKFVSLEPLLGPVNLEPWLPRLHWIIVGGESGPNARPCNVAWVRSIVEQCKTAGVPVFVKQLGSNPQGMSVHEIAGPPRLFPRDRKGGDPSEWPEDLRVREFPV
jgi:protein gp37